MCLAINKVKTKFQYRAIGNETLNINNKTFKGKCYKYLGVDVGYTTNSKYAQINNLTRTLMQPLRSLAWAGNGVGVRDLCILAPLGRFLNMLPTPVLFRLDEGRFGKLQKLQNEAVRIILNCPKYVLLDGMKKELHLPTIRHSIEEINIMTVIKHIRSTGSHELLHDIEDYINNVRTFRRQGKIGYKR